MTYFILSLICLLTYFKQTFNIKLKMDFIILLLLVILTVGNYYNSDYNNYLWVYESETFGIFEDTYNILMIVCHKLNLNYQFFIGIIGIISIYLIKITVDRYCINKDLVYILYLIYPLFLNIIQLRNFIAGGIILFSIRFLLNKEYLKYIIIILFASTLHVSSLFFLLLILIIKINEKQMLIGSIFIIAISIIFHITGITEKIASNFLSPDQVYVYFKSEGVNMGFLIYLFLHTLPLVLLLYFRKIVKINFEKNIILLNNLMIKINMLFLVFLPLYFYSASFERFFRNIQLFNYILLGNIYTRITNKCMKIIFINLLFIYVLISAMFIINISGLDIMNYNWILK